MMSEEFIRRHIVFYGQVQGVGFRFNAYYLAQKYMLTGWVRNEWDGSVTLEIQGRPADVNRYLAALLDSRYVEVDRADDKTIPTDPRGGGFRIIYD